MTFPVELAPSVGYRVRNRQNPPAKPEYQVLLEPQLQLGTPLALWQNYKSSPQFADGHGAQIERLFVLRVNSLADARLGTSANELGRDGRVEQKAAHVKSTGRSVVGWRLKSTSSARPLTASNTSRTLLPRTGADTPAGMWTASSSKLAA